MDPQPNEILLLSGLSGSGKTTFLKALEDIGFFYIDRIPLSLMPQLIEEVTSSHQPERFAIGIDIRTPDLATKTSELIKRLREEGNQVTLLFLEATDDTLIRRYSTTRRPHPVAAENLMESIQLERNKLNALRNIADVILDTSDYNVHTLKAYAQGMFSAKKGGTLTINVMSFGFKHGIPTSCDIVFDVRFVKNPYFVEELRDQRGTDDDVRNFVLEQEETQRILQLFQEIGSFIPDYQKEGKSYLTVGIGCTGGHHRSVAIAEAISDSWRTMGWHVTITHRDVER